MVKANVSTCRAAVVMCAGANSLRRRLPWLVSLPLCVLLAGCGRQENDEPAPRGPVRGQRQVQRWTAGANGFQPSLPIPASQPPSSSRLPSYELRMKSSDLDALDSNPFSNETRPATFVAGGETYPGAKLRVRGAFSRSWPKKSYKLIFGHDKPFEAQQSLNLNSGWRDPAFVREALAYRVYAACGAVAPRSRMIRLNVNGKFRGLYVEVEQPGKEFLSRFNLQGASVYKASSRSNRADERDLGSEAVYRAHYSKETQKAEGYAELQEFCRELQSTPDVLDCFTRHVDVEKYVNYLAATVLVQNWDGFNKNHFLIFDGRGTRKWMVVPWDLDRTFGDHWHGSFTEARLPTLLGTQSLPGCTGWNRLEERFFNEPSLRGRFLDRLEELLNTEFTPEKLFPVLDQLETDIGPEAASDRSRWPGFDSDFHNGILQVKRFIQHRRAFLLAEVPRLR